MRKTIMRFGTALLLACGMSGAWADDDHVMGNYHGGFSGDQGFIRAEVIALGETEWRANFYVGRTEASAQRVEVMGEGGEGTAEFSGEISYAGRSLPITAKIENETMTGTVQAGDQRYAFELERVFLEPPALGKAPPEGAIVLMDEDGMHGWVRHPELWCPQPDGSVQVCGSNLRTIEEFGAAQYHVEFMTPFMPNARGQSRGNSGVYVHGRYEVQVLDSFGDPPADNLAGGIYSIAAPTSNPSLPPLQWQTYEITYIPPTFDDNGEKTEDAEITVIFNGVTVHDKVRLPEATPGGVSMQEAPTGPLLFQDHRDRVRFRNVWVLPLED